LQIGVDCVSVKATTSEAMGFIGRREGLACHAVVLIEKR
jgi:2-C-methyl-D-erythritol 2,4-cyclodiphosphate synthase